MSECTIKTNKSNEKNESKTCKSEVPQTWFCTLMTSWVIPWLICTRRQIKPITIFLLIHDLKYISAGLADRYTALALFTIERLHLTIELHYTLQPQSANFLQTISAVYTSISKHHKITIPTNIFSHMLSGSGIRNHFPLKSIRNHPPQQHSTVIEMDVYLPPSPLKSTTETSYYYISTRDNRTTKKLRPFAPTSTAELIGCDEQRWWRRACGERNVASWFVCIVGNVLRHACVAGAASGGKWLKWVRIGQVFFICVFFGWFWKSREKLSLMK